jgi:AcrR family transcriptional regulator
MSVLGRGPSRARRRTYLRADARRAQILEVAKRVFSRRGFHTSNVADICKEARIGRGTLYQYFDNKHDVLLAVLEDVARRVEEVIRSRPHVSGIPGVDRAPREMIVAFCKKRLRHLLEAVFHDEATLRLILREARGLDRAVERVIARIDETVLDAIIVDTRAAQDAGLLRQGDTRLIAQFILGGVEKMVLSALHGEAAIDLGTIVDTAVDLELFGLLSDRSRSEVRR